MVSQTFFHSLGEYLFKLSSFLEKQRKKSAKIRTKKIPHTSKPFCIFDQNITTENPY